MPTPFGRRGWPPGRSRRSSRPTRRPSTSLASHSSCALCKPMAMFAPTWRVLPRPAFDVETEAPCGTSVAEAREALAFWRRRLKRLRGIAAPPAPRLAAWSRAGSAASCRPSSSAGGCTRSRARSPRRSTGRAPGRRLPARRVGQERAARLGAGADARRRRRGGDGGRRSRCWRSPSSRSPSSSSDRGRPRCGLPDRGHQRLVIALVLVGIGLGERLPGRARSGRSRGGRRRQRRGRRSSRARTPASSRRSRA